MLTYNTQLNKLILPEYGRNIQRMVEHCLTLQDRDERTRCAHAIIESMSNLFPEIRRAEGNDRKFWDHLMIMSDFKLDVDFPFEVVSQESLHTEPEPVVRSQSTIRFQHYGRSLLLMIDNAASMEPGEERDELIRLLANHMKKLMLGVNKDGVDDAKIFKDLYNISEGRIRIEPGTLRLHEFMEAPQPAGKKKKKK